MLTAEYQSEQDRLERKWEDDNEPENVKSCVAIYMPVNIRHLREAYLTTMPPPNVTYLPKAICEKNQANVLQCIRLNLDDMFDEHAGHRTDLDGMSGVACASAAHRPQMERLRRSLNESGRENSTTIGRWMDIR
jgi:hypothetical protein